MPLQLKSDVDIDKQYSTVILGRYLSMKKESENVFVGQGYVQALNRSKHKAVKRGEDVANRTR